MQCTLLGQFLPRELPVGAEEQQSRISIDTKFKIKVVIAVFSYALKIFDSMHDRYEEKNSLKKQVEKEKETYWNIFHSVARKIGHTITLSKMFARTIKERLLAKVEADLREDMKSFMMRSISDKTKLLIHVLESLIDQDWDKFRQYIRNTKSICEDWLKEKITAEYLSGRETQYFKRASILADNNIHTLTELIGNVWKDTEVKLDTWLQSFFSKENTLGLSCSEFSSMRHISNTIDVPEFVQNVKQQLKKIRNELKGYFHSIYFESV